MDGCYAVNNLPIIFSGTAPISFLSLIICNVGADAQKIYYGRLTAQAHTKIGQSLSVCAQRGPPAICPQTLDGNLIKNKGQGTYFPSNLCDRVIAGG